MPAWQDLARKQQPVEARPPDELGEAALQAQRLLRVLRKRYIETVPTGIPDERALLVNHVRRQFVRMLEEAAADALEAHKAKQTTT
jgi:hypothetical protein